uniref:Uncharacterized protein n=1 Tax=Myoviridae sp. ctwwN25 TaxID=2825209 RepID=A0A8S5PPD4_9CAUD|nr:MAG TPA: hypothetical protein [Myoviridae sp. ctwwN25]DAR38439.1 MAG TPA: hypothetical protein [Caudoviricetes sp.]
MCSLISFDYPLVKFQKLFIRIIQPFDLSL